MHTTIYLNGKMILPTNQNKDEKDFQKNITQKQLFKDTGRGKNAYH